MNALVLLLVAAIAPDADFFTASTARLRAGAAPDAKVLAKIPAGARVEVAAAGRRGAAVEIVKPLHGFVARGALAAFPPGDGGTRELAAAGRFLAQDPDRRALALAFLERADERMRGEGKRDGALLVLVAETREALGLPAGDAFRDALGAGAETTDLRERAEAGILRARFPSTSRDFVALWTETAAWLDLAERARTVLPEVAPRLESSALALGRLLLAAGKLGELKSLGDRVEGCAARLAALDDEGAPRLGGAAQLLSAMRGDGTPPFPQHASWGTGPAPLVASIGGELGALTLTAGGEAKPLPVLPVPGSLRIAPDGRSVAWLEVSAPGTIVPMIVRVARGDAGGDATLLAGGRLTRDRTRKARVLCGLLGFSPEGDRLLVSVSAWDDAPPARGRLAIVSARTGDLTWDAPGRARQLLEARLRLGYRSRESQNQ